MQGKTPKEAKALAGAKCSESNIRMRVHRLESNGFKRAVPPAKTIKMKTAFKRSSAQVDKVHAHKQHLRRLGSQAFKQVCMEAQKNKEAKLSGAKGPFPSIEELCEVANAKLDRERQGRRPRREAPVHILL